MPTSRLGQVLAAILVLVLGATGFASLSNAISLDKINQVLAGLDTQVLPTATPLGVPDQVGGGTVEEPGLSESSAAASDVLLFPTISDTLVLSPDALTFQVRLHNPLTETAASLETQLFIVQTGDGTALSPGLSSQPARLETLEPGQTASLALQFAQDVQLPASGKYAGWLIVRSEQLTPLSQPVNVFITRPDAAIQYRLSSADEPAILISGVDHLPCLVDYLCKGPNLCVSWQPYQLFLWEQELQSVPYVLVSSELANPLSGETGWLEISQPSGLTQSDEPLPLTLNVRGIRNPGEYQGTLSIFFPQTQTQETLAVTARLRHSMYLPFLVITAGAVVAGFLLRIGTSADKSVSYQKVVLRMLQERLRRLPLRRSDLIWREIDGYLLQAEALLRLPDLEAARDFLKKASDKLQSAEGSGEDLNKIKEEVDKVMLSREVVPASAKAARTAEVQNAVRDLLARNPQVFEEAHRDLANGQLAEVDKIVDEFNAILARQNLQPSAPPAQLAHNLEALGADWGRDVPRESHIELLPQGGPQPPAAESGGDHSLRLQTGQEVTFHVKMNGKPFEKPFTWQVWRMSGTDTKLYEVEKEVQFTYTPQADELGVYPQQCRVIARSGSIEPRPLDFALYLPYTVKVDPGRLVSVKDALWLSLDPAPPASPQITWHVIPPAARPGAAVQPRQIDALPYYPDAIGEYRFLAKREEQWVASVVIKVGPSLLQQELGRYQRSAWLATAGWAAVAGISGLTYISAKLNTFGSGLDYLLALAWGLGVGTVTTPNEGLKESIQRFFNPASGGGSSERSDVEPKPAGGTPGPGAGAGKAIPNFVKQTYGSAKAIATSFDLALVPDVLDARDEELIYKQDPEPTADAKNVTEVKVFIDR